MQDGICYLVGAGEPYGRFARTPDDLVIAADGGVRFLQTLGITPDFAVGDWDSFDQVPHEIPHLTLPTEKEKTDMAVAAEEGLSRGYRKFRIYGGLGGRTDHSIANIKLLNTLTACGAEAFLIGEHETVTVLKNGQAEFSAEYQGILSVFPCGGEANGVTLSGLKYPLQEATLSADSALGVSNQFIGQTACIRVKQGTLLLLWTANSGEPFPVIRKENRL